MADFETTTDPDDCRVWGWGLCDVPETPELQPLVELGTDIDGFLARLSRLGGAVVWFHNLRFDGQFVVDRLLKTGYRYAETGRRTFSTLISRMGKWYSVTIRFDNGTIIELRDSLKKFPNMTVANVAKTFKLPESKLAIDYHQTRPVGHELTDIESEYIAADVVIVAKAISAQLLEGMSKMTIGADSLAEYKKLTGGKLFTRRFPILAATLDADIRLAYRGGWTYANPEFSGRVVGGGRVFDVNSLYPYIMYDRPLPWGEPKWQPGTPKPNRHYPLYITSITFTAKLKPGRLPCIQVKSSPFMVATEYQTEIAEPVTMACTNVDLALWREHYDLEILAWNGTWLFHAAEGMFTEFIDKWSAIKEASTGGRRLIAKFHLNNLYGKFATNPDVQGKVPYLDETGTVRLSLGPEETRDPVYTAVGVFITSWARDLTIRAAQQHAHVFAYADTDSLHLLGDGPISLDIHPTRLGAWKHELDFDAAIYGRAKCYSERVSEDEAYDKTCPVCQAGPGLDCEQPGGVMHPARRHETHIAGVPSHIADKVDFSTFRDGQEFGGKLVPHPVPGGIVLTETTFTLAFTGVE